MPAALGFEIIKTRRQGENRRRNHRRPNNKMADPIKSKTAEKFPIFCNNTHAPFPVRMGRFHFLPLEFLGLHFGLVV